MDNKWFQNLQKAGFTYDTVFSNGRYEDLKTKLLDRGGKAVILVYDIDSCYQELLSEGKFFGQNFFLKEEHKGFWLADDEVWRWGYLGPSGIGGVKEFYGIRA